MGQHGSTWSQLGPACANRGQLEANLGTNWSNLDLTEHQKSVFRLDGNTIFAKLLFPGGNALGDLLEGLVNALEGLPGARKRLGGPAGRPWGRLGRPSWRTFLEYLGKPWKNLLERPSRIRVSREDP